MEVDVTLPSLLDFQLGKIRWNDKIKRMELEVGIVIHAREETVMKLASFLKESPENLSLTLTSKQAQFDFLTLTMNPENRQKTLDLFNELKTGIPAPRQISLDSAITSADPKEPTPQPQPAVGLCPTCIVEKDCTFEVKKTPNAVTACEGYHDAPQLVDNSVDKTEGTINISTGGASESVVDKETPTTDKPARRRRSKKDQTGEERKPGTCANCGVAPSPEELAAMVANGVKICAVCGFNFFTKAEQEAPENGGNDNHGTEEVTQSFEVIDLTTFDMNEADGIAVPAKFFLLGKSEEAINEDNAGAIMRLFAQNDVVAKSRTNLVKILEKYPVSDNCARILELLKDKEDKDWEAMQRKPEPAKA